MDSRTRMQLRALNRRFYRHHAAAFDASRAHPWPGWERVDLSILGDRPRPLRVLDVGCGNARFAEVLRTRLDRGFSYTGIDENEQLLERARERLAGLGATSAELIQTDVLADDPDEALPPDRFDLVVAFGLLHHVPGSDLRVALVSALADRVDECGLLALTAWQFADRPRFARKLVPWSAWPAGTEGKIDTARLDEGDHLLSFEGDLANLRYCHHCSEDELDELAAAIPLAPRARFSADGRSGDLNRYLVFERVAARATTRAI